MAATQHDVLQPPRARRSALLLFGLAYHETLRPQWAVDFRHSIRNYRETLIDGFLERGDGVDVFLCTKHPGKRMLRMLLSAYQPRRYCLSDDIDVLAPDPTLDGSCSGHEPNDECLQSRWKRVGMHNRNLRLVGAIRLCLDFAREHAITYGWVLITRFDLHFTESLRHLSIHPACVNLAAHVAPYNAVDDNLYVVPFRLLHSLHGLLSSCNQSLADPHAGRRLKFLLQRSVAPVHVMLDQGHDLPFWKQAVLTLVRCRRPHSWERACQPATGPDGLDAAVTTPAFGTWSAVVEYKRRLLRRFLLSGLSHCATHGPFALMRSPLAAGERRAHPTRPVEMRPGARVLLTQLRSKNMARLNGSIALVLDQPSRSMSRRTAAALVHVQVLSPPHLAITEGNRPVTWMLRPHHVLLGSGATPEEVAWCALLQRAPRLAVSLTSTQTTTT